MTPNANRAASSGPCTAGAGTGASGRALAGDEGRGPLRALLGVRLYVKILVANAVIVLAAIAGTAAAGRVLAAGLHVSPAAAIAAFAGVGVLLTIAVNAVILRIALRPLHALEETAARVREGDLHARAPLSRLAERDLTRLIRTFNGMLDQISRYRARLRTITARALDSAEDERKRISRELHDDTAQAQANLLIRLRAARAARDAERRDALLDELRDEIAAMIERTRRYAQGLRPPALDMLGLVPALESHARRVSETTGLRVEVVADRVDGLLSNAAELALYRIVQEALSNVVRHARARRVRVVVRREPGRVAATVEDDGRGFDVDAVRAERDRGLGLFGMEERAVYAGGRVVVHSTPGGGTRVEIRIPFEESAEMVANV